MSVKIRGSNVKVSSSAFKYSIAQDRATLVTGDASKTFSLNQYDMVFTSLNQYDPLYFQMTLSPNENSSLASSGTITLTLEREIEE